MPVASAVREQRRLSSLANDYEAQLERAKSLNLKTDFAGVIDDLPELGKQDASAIVSLMVDQMGRPTRSRPNRVPVGVVTGPEAGKAKAIQAKFAAMAREIGAKKTFSVWRTKATEEEVAEYQTPVSVTTGLVLMSMEAGEEAGKGQDEQCLANLKSIAQFGRMLTDCASLGSYNSRLNSLSILLQTVQFAAAQRSTDAQFLHRLRTEVVDLVTLPDPRPAVRNEAYFSMRRAQKTLDSRSPVLAAFGVSQSAAAAWSDPNCQRAAKALMLQSWNDLASGLDKSWPSWPQMLAATKENSKRSNFGTRADRTPEKAIARAFAPAFLGAVTTGQSLEARRQLVSAWLRVYEHRARHGEFPDALDPQVPDPYSGGQLVYSRTGRSFLLYSVGADGKDNGGIVSNPQPSKGLDLGFDPATAHIVEIKGH